MSCTGTGEHCCYLDGSKCPFVLEGDDAPGEREHACGLVVQHGSWDAAMASPEYGEVVRPMWRASGLPEDVDCSTWPQRRIERGDLELGPWACCFAEGVSA